MIPTDESFRLGGALAAQVAQVTAGADAPSGVQRSLWEPSASDARQLPPWVPHTAAQGDRLPTTANLATIPSDCGGSTRWATANTAAPVGAMHDLKRS